MDAVALAPGEATMNVRVIRKDGTVEEMPGQPVTVELDEALVAEYRALSRRLLEIETLLLGQCMKGI